MKLPCSKIAHPGVCLKNTVTLLFLTGKRTWALVSPPPPGVINIMASCSYGKFPGCMSPLPYLLYQPFTLTMRYSLQMHSRMQFSFVAATKQLTCSLNCPLGTDFRQHLTWVPYVRFLSLWYSFPRSLQFPICFSMLLVALVIMNLPASAGDAGDPRDVVQSLGQEDLLEEEIATHSSILAWKIPWTEEPGGLQSMGSHRVRHDWAAEHTCTGSNTHASGAAVCLLSFSGNQGPRSV